MQYMRLGTSGLKVSRVALGITFWDTANAYGYGTSEEIVGRAIRKDTQRDDIVLATKVFFKMHDGPGGSGLSRKAIMEQIDASLSRLGTDYVDLYQIHRFDPRPGGDGRAPPPVCRSRPAELRAA